MKIKNAKKFGVKLKCNIQSKSGWGRGGGGGELKCTQVLYKRQMTRVPKIFIS